MGNLKSQLRQVLRRLGRTPMFTAVTLITLAAGVGAKKTLDGVLPEWAVVLTGSVLVGFAAFCFVAAVWRELFPGTPPPEPDVHRLPRALLFALNGFLALVALAVLLCVWFGHTDGT